MSPSDRAALKAITDELRTLPDRGDSAGERLQSAGRLLIEAIKAGAFAEPRFVGFKAMVRQRREQPKVDGFVSAWSEAVWWLRGRPKEALDHVGDLAGDVELVIAGMLARPKSKKPAGRPLSSDPKRDRRISEAWNAGQYRSFDEFAGTDAGRQFGLTARDLRAAHDRHRKRQSRRAVK